MALSRRDTSNSKDFTPIFTWGSNEFGQLGLNTVGEAYPQVRSTSLSVVITQISAGQGHALFLSREGYVYSTGLNSEGQLGITNDEQQQPIIMKTIPSLIMPLKALQIIQVSCGGFHSAAVSSNGLLLTWGNNQSGQLGTGNCRNSAVPQIVDLRQNNSPRMVSCGLHNTIVLAESGAVFGFGDGRHGQFGYESVIQHKQNNSESGFQQQQHIFTSPVQILPGSNDWVQISAGDTHCLFLSKTGLAYSLGDNSFHQLGHHLTSSSTSHKGNQKVHYNPSYSCYQVDQDSIRFVQIQSGQKQPISAGLSVQGDMYLWGSGFFGECSTPTKFNCLRGNLIDFSLGDNFIIVLDRYGNAYVWGENDQGQLGLGYGTINESQISTPMKIRELKRKDNIKRVFAGGNSLFALGEDWIHERETNTNRQLEIQQNEQQFLNCKKLSENVDPQDGYNSQESNSCLGDEGECQDDGSSGIYDVQATNKSLDRLSIDDSQLFEDIRTSSVGVSNQKRNEKQKSKKLMEKQDNSKNLQSSYRELVDQEQFNTQKYQKHQWESQQQSKQTQQDKGFRNTALLSKYLAEHTRRRSCSLIQSKYNKNLDISQINYPSQIRNGPTPQKSTYECGVRMKYEKLKVKAKRMQLERDDLAEKLNCERALNEQLKIQQKDNQLIQEQLQQQLILLEKELISDRQAFRVKISELKARIPSADGRDVLQSQRLNLEKQQQLKKQKNKDNNYLRNQNTVFSFGNNHSIPSPPVKDYASVSSKTPGYITNTYDQDLMKQIGNSSNRSNYSGSNKNSSRERNTLGRSYHRENIQQQQQFLEASMISTAAHSFSNTPGGVGSRPPHSPLSKTTDQFHYNN